MISPDKATTSAAAAWIVTAKTLDPVQAMVTDFVIVIEYASPIVSMHTIVPFGLV
jgi:hypothetical protein